MMGQILVFHGETPAWDFDLFLEQCNLDELDLLYQKKKNKTQQTFKF